jgi:hypothetical protein
MEATRHEEAQMCALLGYAYHLLSDAEQVAAGQLVRVTLRLSSGHVDTEVMQPRVAAYLLQAVGDALPFNDNEASIEFADSRHATGQLFLSGMGIARVLQAWIAWSKADRRKLLRELSRCKRQVNQLRKGGLAA